MTKIPSWKINRLLQFLNEAQSTEDLTQGIQDTTADQQNLPSGRGYAIGETVAQRILETRDNLRFRRFREFSEVEGIPGLGKDKINDIIENVCLPAALAFRNSMYDGVIFENWELDYQSFHFLDEAEFLATVESASNLIDFVAEKVEQMSMEQFNNPTAAELAAQILRQSYFDHYEDGHYGSFAFGFWFYQFDADNWFSFERVREETEKYLSYYTGYQDRLEFYLFKEFENNGVLVSAISQDGLPVVVNYAERVITIWVSQLFD